MIKSEKFWEWMEKKNYAIWEPDDEEWIHRSVTSFTKQMLVQYMIEYLLLKGHISYRRFGHWLAEQMADYLKLKNAKYGIDNPSEIIFEILKEKIEGLE